MNQNLHEKMMEMVEKAGRTGLSSNVPFREEQFSELVKLRQLSILQAAYETHSTEINLPVVAREEFTKSLVNIAYSYAGIDKHRQKRHSYEFFRDNIAVYDGNHLHFAENQINPETMLLAFSPERIYNERFYKLDGMDTFAIFRDVKKKHQEKESLNLSHQMLRDDLLSLGLASGQQASLLNPEIMELLRMQQQLLQTAIEQQKLTMLNAHPELLQQIGSPKPQKQLEDNSIQLLIEHKLNEKTRT